VRSDALASGPLCCPCCARNKLHNYCLGCCRAQVVHWSNQLQRKHHFTLKQYMRNQSAGKREVAHVRKQHGQSGQWSRMAQSTQNILRVPLPPTTNPALCNCSKQGDAIQAGACAQALCLDMLLCLAFHCCQDQSTLRLPTASAPPNRVCKVTLPIVTSKHQHQKMHCSPSTLSLTCRVLGPGQVTGDLLLAQPLAADARSSLRTTLL
jgi:hypothetical protein